MEHIDTIVIGAGVVGLATARVLAQKGREVLIVESETVIGSATSSRNSGVIHAGIYYNPGSLKAQTCVTGREKLYAYAHECGIPHRQCGKLIVATAQDQIEKLHEWHTIATQNGVPGMRFLTAQEAKTMEPEVFCVEALHIPVTGIIDVHEYMHALLADAEDAGAMLALRAPVTKGEITGERFILEVGGEAPMRISCKTLINAAGLGAQNIARNLHGLAPETIPPQVLAKGNYFNLSGKPPFKMLVYPLPVFGSSGLHATCDMAGQVRFGPDVEWVDHIDYSVDPSRAAGFEESIRNYWPNLPEGALQPDYCGIRPKIARASPHDIDFVIQTQHEHHIHNLINLYGIESPGLTASLALADEVAVRLG